jgi:S1-C subfamily serine protease
VAFSRWHRNQFLKLWDSRILEAEFLKMRTRRIAWMLVPSVLVACLSWGLAPAIASGQNYAEIVHRNECTRNIGARTDAQNNHQWESLVSLARQFIGNCLDLYQESMPESSALLDIAIGLDEQGKFDDAIPVLGRCVTVKPDAAFCYVELGQALEGLGKPQDARKAYERALSIGGYDQLNASAIVFAKRRLVDIPPTAKPRESETPGASEPSPSTESKKFGTGFVVSNQGHILTNNHVVAGCRTLATRDGKPLEVLNRNVDSDLALLLQPNWSQDDQRLVDTLRRTHLTDEDRDSIWNAYHINLSKDDFVSTLNKFHLSDDEQRAIYDLRFNGSHDESTNTPVAVFRKGPAPKLGDAVVAFGFPLPGLLSSDGNVSSGILSATSGLGNDVRFIQISAPVQPGNSGGPLFDSSGHVIGVVVAKLDALKIAQITGDIPQNVNFAVQWSAVRAFLDEAGVHYQKEISQRPSSTSSTAAAASRIAVAIVCTP